jgi:hypothetical protein
LISRLLKNAHLLRFPHPLSLRRTAKYASLLRISGACAKPLRRRQEGSRERDFAKLNLHLNIFEQPEENDFFSDHLLIDLLKKGNKD